MSTALKTDEEKKEYFDSEEVLEQKITQLAQWIKESKHFIAFTGAGISTSAGIPDFRSGVNTVLKTGPGAWEARAQGITTKGDFRAKMGSAVPTPCHMSIVKLQQVGLLKFLISQNTDGLHRKSGFPVTKLAELHGNTNLEKCRNPLCKKEFMRDFRTRTAQNVKDHRTGRMCENCGQELHDSIINFGESLPEKDLMEGYAQSEKADLCLALGSSLRVTPAANMPAEVARHGGKLVIVNLQATPLDKHALRINGFVDDVLFRLMKKLDLEIPPFKLRRRVEVGIVENEKFLTGLRVRGVDSEGTPYTLFKYLKVTFNESNEKVRNIKEGSIIYPNKSDIHKDTAKIEMTFQGHYNEPDFSIDVALNNLEIGKPLDYLISFDPYTGQWSLDGIEKVKNK